MDDGLSAVERLATIIEAVEAGQITRADLTSISAEVVALLADLTAAPAGWASDLGRSLLLPSDQVLPGLGQGQGGDFAGGGHQSH